MKILDIITESHNRCPHCGGPLVSESELMEKKDACYYKIKSSAKVWPSAYASGRLVQCRKKGAANYGNKSESMAEGLTEMDNRTPSGDREEQRRNRPEAKAKQDKEQQNRLKDTSPEMRKKLRLPEPKEGVAEGIEDNYNKNDAGIKAALQAGVKLIPVQAQKDATGKPIYIHDNSGRYTVAVDLGGISVPFYNSTGDGGKASVAVDKWYPFFGIGPDGWINKGSEATINDFYGSNKLKRIAQVLDNTLKKPSRAKNVSGWSVNKGDENYFISIVNRGLDPAANSDRSTKLRDNMLGVLRGLGEPNKYVEKHAVRPKGIVFDKNNPEHVKAMDATSQSERELATALATEPKGVAEGENWSKHNNKRAGGMSKKSVSVYRREHPGSKIQTAVTTKPSKLKKGSKAAARRKSFCARMRGMKKHRTGAKTAHDPNSNINKSLRRWHCESVEELHELVMLAEQYIRNNKK
jgi:hypothetical protein